MLVEVPEILNIPKKLIEIPQKFNLSRFFLIEGGRGSAKTQSIARLLLYIAEKRKVRIVCGRETQATIEESVHKVLADLIRAYNLDFTIQSNRIFHNKTGSTFTFKGFREQGSVNIKGLEGVDILWIDEAEAITPATLQIIIPTIRKPNSKIIFTMNRKTRHDAVVKYLQGDPDCLHIKINYWDNPFCPEELRKEAEKLKKKNYKEWLHVYGGEPLEQGDEYLFNYSYLDKARSIKPIVERFRPVKVMSVDLAAGGGDLTVVKIIESISNTQFRRTYQYSWSEPDTNITKGKIISHYAKHMPNLRIIDKGGLGYPIWCDLKDSIPDLIGFDGAGESRQENAGNQRADGYLVLKEFMENEFIEESDETTLLELENIKKVYKPNGKIYIQSKADMKKEGLDSPDHADSLMMGVYALNYYSHLLYDDSNSTATYVESDFDPFE